MGTREDRYSWGHTWYFDEKKERLLVVGTHVPTFRKNVCTYGRIQYHYGRDTCGKTQDLGRTVLTDHNPNYYLGESVCGYT